MNAEPFFDKDFKASAPEKSHWHLYLLVGSLCVNAAVMTYLFAQWNDGVLWFEVETRPRLESAPQTVAVSSNALQSELSRLWSLSDQELLMSLRDLKIASNGYEVRELALSILESRGYQVQDPLRAVGLPPVTKTAFSWKDKGGSLHTTQLYSSLKERHFAEVERYCSTTEVPFSPEGIVARLATDPANVLLRAALARTDEWATLRKSFSDRSEEEIYSLSIALGHQGFSNLVDFCMSGAALDALNILFLKLFRENPSKSMAEYIAAHVANYTVSQATDEEVLLILQHLPSSSESGVRLAMRLLKAQRKALVWSASQAYLATEKGLEELSSLPRDQALAFLQKKAQPLGNQEAVLKNIPKTNPVIIPKTSPKEIQPSETSIVSSRLACRQLRPYQKYRVKKGDTMWSIAKRFNVDVEKLKYLNGLKGKDLPTGRELRIPH